MLMKHILSPFQFDWAASPKERELKPNVFKNKSVFVCGHELARAFAYTLLTLNDQMKLGANVILSSPDERLQETVTEEIFQRDDFTYADIFHAEDVKQKVDIIIYTGLCAHRCDESFDSFKAESDALENCMRLSDIKKLKQVYMLSDSRVYGTGQNKFRAFAEKELSFVSPDDFTAQALRTLECDYLKLASDRKLKPLIIRTGVVLGGGSGVYNGLDELFDSVAHGREYTAHGSSRKLSFVYISDIFDALVYFMTKKKSGVYNISSKESSASTGTVCAILHDIFGSQAKLGTTDSGYIEGNELNCELAQFTGYSPTIDLKTALQLCVMSYLDSFTDNFYFPDEHKGRLESIQQLLLGYLLEVDRICKKHNIKWYLGGGTLLGAARHKGFIPWDDDVDIMMLREDYDKFLEVAPAELPDGMILCDPKKDKYYNYAYAKLRLTDTTFATDFSKNHKNMSNGFSFDIFCHDKTANSRLGQRLHVNLTLFWLAMVFNKWNHRKVDNGKKFQSAVSNFFKNIFPLRFSMRMLLFTIEMFKHKKKAKYLYDGMGKIVHQGGFDKSYMDNEVRIDFCGYKMPAPEKYMEYLDNHYDDFMSMSPLSTRLMGHEITLSDLGKYADFRISNIYNNVREDKQ